MKSTMVIGGTITLYSFVDHDTAERVYKCAALPAAIAPDWENTLVYVLNWKIDPEAETVLLTYQFRNDLYAPIHDTQFALVTERIPLKKPNKSKNWKLDQYEDCWVNQKTRERVYV